MAGCRSLSFIWWLYLVSVPVRPLDLFSVSVSLSSHWPQFIYCLVRCRLSLLSQLVRQDKNHSSRAREMAQGASKVLALQVSDPQHCIWFSKHIQGSHCNTEPGVVSLYTVGYGSTYPSCTHQNYDEIFAHPWPVSTLPFLSSPVSSLPPFILQTPIFWPVTQSPDSLQKMAVASVSALLGKTAPFTNILASLDLRVGSEWSFSVRASERMPVSGYDIFLDENPHPCSRGES